MVNFFSLHLENKKCLHKRTDVPLTERFSRLAYYFIVKKERPPQFDILHTIPGTRFLRTDI